MHILKSRLSPIPPWLLIVSAIVLTCLGSPNRLLHHPLAVLIGIAPLFYLCEKQSLGQQIRTTFTVWFPFCLFVFLPDLFSVKVLEGWEYLGGILLAPLLPLFYMAATILSLRLTTGCPIWIRPLGMAAVWTALDGLMGFIWFPIPFHWGSLLFDWPLGIQISDVTGIWGVTFFAVALNATLACVFRMQWPSVQSWRLLGITLGMTILVLGYGAIRLPIYEQVSDPAQDPIQHPHYRVGALQQLAWFETKDRSWPYREQRYLDLQRLSQQALAQGSHLIIWPEGALRARLVGTSLEPYILGLIIPNLLPEGGFITGATEPDPRSLGLPESQVKYINTALLYNTQGKNTDRYGKQWLFPYFETARFVPSPDGYRPLEGGSVLGQLGVMICLESVLPEPSRRLVQRGAQSLITISDDSWFGNSNWPMLHGNLGIFRAIENRRSFVFVNNTGGNLIVDPSGRVQQAGQIFERGVVIGSVTRRDEITFFNRAGNWFLWIMIVLSGGLWLWTLKE